jgi:uncharacterized damage-inducible protein DinB
MKNSETLSVLQFSNRVITINLEGITHEDSLVSPPGGGNSINWVLGHMIVSRDDIREIVGLKRLSDGKMPEIYERGSKQLEPESALPIEELRSKYNGGQKEFEDAISATDFTDRPEKLKELTFLAFHEAYHSGQTGLLRRITGKEGAIK